jgi:hypothetical protein
MPRSKSRQISFREKIDLFAQVQEAAEREDLHLADFVRKIFRLSFRAYNVVGSLHAFRMRLETAEWAKDQVAIEEKVAKQIERDLGKRSDSKKKLRQA